MFLNTQEASACPKKNSHCKHNSNYKILSIQRCRHHKELVHVIQTVLYKVQRKQRNNRPGEPVKKHPA